MGKKVSGKCPRGGGEKTAAWSHSDHILRKAKHERKTPSSDKQEKRERRTALLTRDSKEKREEGKLRLHIKRTQNQLDSLRRRLESWDDVEEARIKKEAAAKEQQKTEAQERPKKGRKGPETWKLKGAARPAWMVYDFDVRYDDVHMKEHEDAKIKAKRVRNIFSMFKGRFGEEDEDKTIPQPECRTFLSLLIQLGNLSVQANQLKTARKSFLECMELDSHQQPITPARCHLMRLYVDANRPDSARRLWERLSPEDSSVWIRYSAALIEYVSWKILGEDGSTQETAEMLLARAVKSNVFCAFYLAFFGHFSKIMEYVDEIEDATEETPVEEAIEYCNSEQMGAWQGTEGALAWVEDVILKALHGHPVASGELVREDLEWRSYVQATKEAKETQMVQVKGVNDDPVESCDDNSSASDDEMHGEGEVQPDTAMFAGMFETAMDMLEEEGKLGESSLRKNS